MAQRAGRQVPYVVYESTDRSPWTRRCLRQADYVLWSAGSRLRPGRRRDRDGDPPIGWSRPDRPRRDLVLSTRRTRAPVRDAAWLAAGRWTSTITCARARPPTSSGSRASSPAAPSGSCSAPAGRAAGPHRRHAGDPGARDRDRPDWRHELRGHGRGACWPRISTARRCSRSAARHLSAAGSLLDYTLPLVSLVSGRKIARTSSTGVRDVADRGPLAQLLLRVDQSQPGGDDRASPGPLWKGVRASISLPGILPPVVEDR